MPREFEPRPGEGSSLREQILNGTLSRRDFILLVCGLGGIIPAAVSQIGLIVTTHPVTEELRHEAIRAKRAALDAPERPRVVVQVDNPSSELIDQRLREKGLYGRYQFMQAVFNFGIAMSLCGLLSEGGHAIVDKIRRSRSKLHVRNC